MLRAKSVEEYIDAQTTFKEMLQRLRALISTTELVETVKWGMPTYTIGGKNVLGMSAFKHHAGIWFFQGAILEDKLSVLRNAQEGKTQAMRQWIFKDISELDEEKILPYILEAIENQKQGRVVKMKKDHSWTMPPELKEALSKDPAAGEAFKALTPGRQKEYAEYISTAKREATKQSRIQKILPMITSGIGLGDKYRK